jgi:hypothetical protein
MSTENPQKSPKFFNCDDCHYITCNKKDYSKHILTDKHKNRQKSTDFNKKSPKIPRPHICNCGKIYKERTGLWRHQKKCDVNNTFNGSSSETNISDKEIINLLLEQTKQMMDVIKNGNTYNSNNNINNSHNKTFNLHFFLNETCKDAMNIQDFVDSIKLQLSDLENIGEIGYIEGISNIIVKNLNALDITQRPIHCTDKKREVLYIKDENKWEKEDDEKIKIRNVIKKITNKNIKMIHRFREKYPDCNKSDSNYSDQYNKIILEAMGGKGDNDIEKEDKIIKNISKTVFINKVISN